MKRETAKAINEHLAACEGVCPWELLEAAAKWIVKSSAANTDHEGDACAAKAAACLVAYLEWRPK